VRITIANASGSPPPTLTGEVFLIRMIFVPQNTTCLVSSGATSPPGLLISKISASSTGYFETGTDSPVSIDSLTMASPERSTRSAGKVLRLASETSTTSPGTRDDESSMIPSTEKVSRVE
jgi:hypothetical protein